MYFKTIFESISPISDLHSIAVAVYIEQRMSVIKTPIDIS